MGLIRSVVKKVVVAAAFVVVKRVATKVIGKATEKASSRRVPPAP